MASRRRGLALSDFHTETSMKTMVSYGGECFAPIKRAALKLMRKLIKKSGFLPNMLIKGDQRSDKATGGHLAIATAMDAIEAQQANVEIVSIGPAARMQDARI